VLEGQVECRLPKLLYELAGVRLVARGCQLLVNRQAHVVSSCNAPASLSPTKWRW
jgi:hypothetical protein